MHRLTLRAAALAFVSMAVAAGHATAAVYKCEQPDGGVLYADYACQGGAVVDIRPGTAAPDAMQRLERARDELDRAAARREANEAMLALRREQLYQSSPLAAAESAAPAPDYSYAYGVPYGFYGPYGAYGSFAKDRTRGPGLDHARDDGRRDHGRGDHGRGHHGRLPAAIAPPTRSAIMRR